MDKLILELSKLKLKTDVTTQKGEFVVEITDTNRNRVIGVAKASTVESAFSVIMRNIVNDSLMLKERTTNYDGLSQL